MWPFIQNVFALDQLIQIICHIFNKNIRDEKSLLLIFFVALLFELLNHLNCFNCLNGLNCLNHLNGLNCLNSLTVLNVCTI